MMPCTLFATRACVLRQGEYDSWQMCCDAGYETKDSKTDAQINAWWVAAALSLLGHFVRALC